MNKDDREETIKIVTFNNFQCVRQGADNRYYRLSLYEFRGEPLKAFFVKDLDEGFWDLKTAIYGGRRKAKELNIQFLENVTMGDSIDRLFAKVLS